MIRIITLLSNTSHRMRIKRKPCLRASSLAQTSCHFSWNRLASTWLVHREKKKSKSEPTEKYKVCGHSGCVSWREQYSDEEALSVIFIQSSFYPETHTKRPATQHGCLPSLLGDRDKGIEIVYGVANNWQNYRPFLYISGKSYGPGLKHTSVHIQVWKTVGI